MDNIFHMMSIELEVTQEHIDISEPGCASKCVIAWALKDRGFPNPSVVGPWFRPNHQPSKNWNEDSVGEKPILLPDEVREYISHFDACMPVPPKTFTIPIPEEVYNAYLANRS